VHRRNESEALSAVVSGLLVIVPGPVTGDHRLLGRGAELWVNLGDGLVGN
jgi:hypothetical protein